jgi:hypothetical protein
MHNGVHKERTVWHSLTWQVQVNKSVAMRERAECRFSTSCLIALTASGCSEGKSRTARVSHVSPVNPRTHRSDSCRRAAGLGAGEGAGARRPALAEEKILGANLGAEVRLGVTRRHGCEQLCSSPLR